MFDQMSEGDVLAAGREVAEKQRSDDFLVRIFRKESVGSMQRGELFAALAQCRLEHLAMRETWLPNLIGKGKGGVFEVAFWHISDKLKQVGGPLIFTADGPQGPPNVAVIDQQDWNGPKVLVFPKALRDLASPDVLRLGSSGDGSEMTGSQLRREAQFGVTPAPALAERTLKASEDLDRRERDLAEKRHKMEMEALHDRFARQMEDLRSKLDARAAVPVVQQQVAEPRGSLFKEFLEFAPTLQGFMREWKEVRLAETTAHREQASSLSQVMREAADKQAQAFERAQAKNEERMERLFTEMSKNRGGDGAVLKAQTEATGAMANMALSMIHNAKALLPNGQPGDDKNVVLEIVDKAMPTLEKFFESLLTNAEARKIEAERGLPPGGTDAKRTTLTTTASPPPPPPPSKRAPTSIDHMVAMVKRYADPTEVATYFFDTAVTTPEMDKALNENARDVTKTLGALAITHLKLWYGAEPAKAEKYLESIEQALTAVGKARGQVSDGTPTPSKEPAKDAEVLPPAGDDDDAEDAPAAQPEAQA